MSTQTTPPLKGSLAAAGASPPACRRLSPAGIGGGAGPCEQKFWGDTQLGSELQLPWASFCLQQPVQHGWKGLQRGPRGHKHIQ